MTLDPRDWIFSEIDALPRGSQRELADTLKLDPSAITNLRKHKRVLSADEFLGAIDFLGRLPPHIIERLSLLRNPIESSGFAEDGQEPLVPGLQAEGEVANRWIAAGGQAGSATPTLLPYDLRYPDDQQAAWLVGDGSIEQAARPGDILICTRAGERPNLEEGMLVVLERVRHDGAMVERSARRVRMSGGRTGFAFDSYNPAMNAPLYPGEVGDIAGETKVLAIARAVYRPEV